MEKVPYAKRFAWLYTIVIAITVVIFSRLTALHLEKPYNLNGQANDAPIRHDVLTAKRGIIMDRNEEVLTNNILTNEVVGDRNHLRELNVVVSGLAYNQAIHTPEWEEKPDEESRNKLLQKIKSTLLDNARRELTREEKIALRQQIDSNDPNANRKMEQDPETCAQYYKAHDELVAEILYPFLSGTELAGGEETEEDEPSAKRFITKQDIINMIAQPEVEAYNKQAAKQGDKPKTFRQRIVLARGIAPETAEKIKEAIQNAQILGISIQSNQRRKYVAPQSLCHVLGYVNHENKGMSGVEAYFNSYLSGIDGMREYRCNARGLVLPHADDRYMPPKHGLNLRLTIDMRLQAICEEELDRGMRHFKAKKGCMIVVDPRTGDILAMVSRPAFNLNSKKLITPYGEMDKPIKDAKGNKISGFFNYACQARYEPGSTFKVVGVTTALEKKVLTLNSIVKCSWFAVAGKGTEITDKPYRYPDMSMANVLKKSSNPGAARIVLACKWPYFKEFIHLYGLDTSAGIDLPSGGACMVSDGNNIVNLSRMAYGYSISVSPLHMAMVYATIANKGVRMKPRLIDKIITDDGAIYDECPPQEVCRVMSEKTAKDLLVALESVTDNKTGSPLARGTATRARIPGFRIGGKTGTAKKVSAHGGYTNNLYTVSFAGILPVNDPRLVVMTVIDEPVMPNGINPGGGSVAAPIFRHAAERFINVLNLTPSQEEEYKTFSQRDRSKDDF